MDNRRSRLVYTTEDGNRCPACQQRLNRCRCRPTPAGKADGIVRIGLSVKGRKGKPVTTVSGFPADDTAMKQVAAGLKRKCGSGGTVKQGVIEIQGDHRQRVLNELAAMGYTVRRSGG